MNVDGVGAAASPDQLGSKAVLPVPHVAQGGVQGKPQAAVALRVLEVDVQAAKTAEGATIMKR